MLKRTVVAALAACGVWSVQAEATLKGWTVYVNGEAKRDLEVRVRDGKLCVHKLVGFYMIFK